MPRDGLFSAEDKITITGVVNDIVSGGTDPMVTINGQEVDVNNGTFIAENFQLVPGPNIIEVVATDKATPMGNVSDPHSITVTYKKPVGPRMKLFSGDRQSAEVGSTLPQPLIAQIVDELGNPVTGHMVKFEVTRNNGTVNAIGNGIAASPRIVAVPTDGLGKAQVNFTLGTRSGTGNNRVRVTSAGVAGEIEFCATGEAGPATQIVATEGFTQRGVLGEPLPIPLEVMVKDSQGNPVGNVLVDFEVVEGGGNLGEGATFSKFTRADGKARAVFALGVDEGINNNRVEVSFDGMTNLNAVFTGSGVQPGNPLDTTFRGVVLDNAQQPIPNATVSIDNGGTPATTFTDDEGQFLFPLGIPVGHIHLNIDPSTTTRTDAVFPPLSFETVTIAGVENILGQSIELPPLGGSQQFVGGNEDVILTMPGIPGLELKVFANSVRFPGGSTTGNLSISQVQRDKSPMPPANGVMPHLLWTIQPAGVQFNPPAQLTLPNEGLSAGTLTSVFQFDHDVFQFVSIGNGHVSEDGLTITTDPGFGISRSGWGNSESSPPSGGSSNGTCEPNECQKCDGNGKVVPDVSAENRPCFGISQNDEDITIDKFNGTATFSIPLETTKVNVKVHDTCGGRCDAKGKCRLPSKQVPGNFLQLDGVKLFLEKAIERILLKGAEQCVNEPLRGNMISDLANGLEFDCKASFVSGIDAFSKEHCLNSPGVQQNPSTNFIEIFNWVYEPTIVHPIPELPNFTITRTCGDPISAFLHELVHTAGNIIPETIPEACVDSCTPGHENNSQCNIQQ